MKKEYIFKIITIIIVLMVLVMAILALILDKLDNSYVYTIKTEENVSKEEPVSEKIPIEKETFNEETIETKKPIKENESTSKSNSNNNISNEIKDKNQEVISEKPEEETIVPKTLKEQNEDLIKEIYNTYGYKVSYNDEPFYYGGSPSVYLSDEEKANTALKTLKKTSNLFPKGFFKTFQGYNGYRILLFEDIPGAAGVASYEFGDDNKLALDINEGFVGRTFYHETWHIMEKYIEYKTYNKPDPFVNWNSFNPTGFSYGSSGKIYTVLDYNFDTLSYSTPISEVAFISQYAKTRPNEDRAELFADLMFRPYAKDYMASGYGINEKAKALALIIRNFFPNSNGASWERWITW